MMVKICGITNREDALAAMETGASALGFNFWPASPRYVAPERAGELLALVPAGVWKVGIFVNEARERVEWAARTLVLDVAQLHGQEAPRDYPSGVRVWKGFRAPRGAPAEFAVIGDAPPAGLVENASISAQGGRGRRAAFEVPDLPAEAVLIDGPSSGRPFDWSLAAGLPQRIIIAGGLDSGNVRQAIAAARPWGVDACSRLESAPGRKDHAKMARFVLAAREAFIQTAQEAGDVSAA
ncbi:MAG: phosphoribosylanthranilate isomerase [Acidobacteria bacterium]|nr:phosphoribosylanthranilate isomerase [Acidobacteriota bacterium]